MASSDFPLRTAAALHAALPAELLLSAIVDSSDDAILSKSLDGTIASWNRGAERIFGYSAEEMLGRSIMDLIPLDHRNEEVEILARIQRGERIDHVETVRLRKDGSVCSVALTISPIRGHDGRIIGASNVARDLSVQQQFAETRNLLAAIVASSDDAMISKNLDGIITSWNAGAERVFGYTQEEIVGRSVLTLIPPELHTDEPMILGRLRRGERIDHFETTRVRKDGRKIRVSLTISPLRDGRGQLFGASKVARDISAQSEAEIAIRRLAAIVDSSDDAIISKDLKGIISTWNAGAERIFGYTAAEAIGQPVTMLMPPEKRGEEPLILARIARGERIEHHETIRQRKNGELFPISLTVSAIRDGAGKVVGASKIARDVSKQKVVEEERNALLKKEQDARSELEAMIEASRGLTAELNLDATVQKATDVATKLTNAKFGAFFHSLATHQEESYAPYALSGVPHSDFEKFGLPLNAALFGPDSTGDGVMRIADVTTDPRYRKKSSDAAVPEGYLPIRSYLAAPVVSRLGERLGGLFFGHPDVGIFTERAERIVAGIASQAAVAIDNAKLYSRLVKSLARLNFSLGALELGDWSWDATTDEMQFSDRTADIYGLPRGVNCSREAMRAALHPEDQDAARRAASDSAANGVDYEIEYRVLHPLKGELWVMAKGRPQFGEDKKLTGMMGVVQDITERKQIEIELRDSRDRLEHHVAERTEKLRETVGELEAFSYSVSHDMRTPLRSMHGYAERLLTLHREGLNEEAIHHLERISYNARRLELLVRDVLAYSKVAKADIELQPVDLNRFLKEFLPTLEEGQGERAVFSIQEPLPVVRAHAAYLTQVFSNLIGNAVKFAAPGKMPTIEISASVEKDRATIRVKDNGIGIAPEHFERIFEIFNRVYSDKKFEGTGIGLSIVRKAVQRMGGQITVQSTLGEGSSFIFTLQTA